MPTYQYACTECGERLEVVQKFTDDPLTVCPACDGKLRKLFSAVGIVFKGSGFYRTDSRNGSGSAAAPATASKKANGSDGAAASSDSGSGAGSGSAESKPAAKTEAAGPGSGSGTSASGTKVA